MAMDAEAKTARRKVEKIAKQFGATVEAEIEGHSYEVRVIAPEDHHFGDGIHEYVQSCFVGPWSYAVVWETALAKLAGNAPEACHEACEYWEGE